MAYQYCKICALSELPTKKEYTVTFGINGKDTIIGASSLLNVKQNSYGKVYTIGRFSGYDK